MSIGIGILSNPIILALGQRVYQLRHTANIIGPAIAKATALARRKKATG